jgi:hypothetical protein
MIHIVGTRHSLQYWSDAIRNGEDCDADFLTVERFEKYLQAVATSVHAAAIAEELSRECVEERQGGASVAKQVADRLGLRHLYCDPESNERSAHGVSNSDEREEFWISRIQPLIPNSTSVIFVCRANHSLSFKAKLNNRGLHAAIYCKDWTLSEVSDVKGLMDGKD